MCVMHETPESMCPKPPLGDLSSRRLSLRSLDDRRLNSLSGAVADRDEAAEPLRPRNKSTARSKL